MLKKSVFFEKNILAFNIYFIIFGFLNLFKEMYLIRNLYDFFCEKLLPIRPKT